MIWRTRRDLNSRPLPSEGSALLLTLAMSRGNLCCWLPQRFPVFLINEILPDKLWI